MAELCKSNFVLLVFLSLWVSACAADPSLEDPYEENGYFWPYESVEPEGFTSCELDPEAPLGRLSDGTPINVMTCDTAPEGDFPICASFTEEGELAISWDGVNGFAVFVTEPQAVIPSAPNTPVSEGETFWSIGPMGFPTDGFASPLYYQILPEGMEDVTTDHGGQDGGATLSAGLCYKITIINKAFQRASVIIGWE